MSELLETIRAIVRHELARQRAPELGTVTAVFAHESESSDGNHQVNVRLQASGVELQRAAVVVPRSGLSALPAVGELVVVAFLGGDLNAPVVLGAVYDREAHPPVGKPPEVVYQPPDPADSGVRRIHVEVPGGVLTWDDDTFHLETGGTTLELAKDGDVTIHAATKVRIEADSNVELEASGDLVLKAAGNVTIEGVAVTLKGQGAAKLQAPQITLAGNTGFSPA